jgi:hypothetical protein
MWVIHDHLNFWLSGRTPMKHEIKAIFPAPLNDTEKEQS